MPRTVVRHEAEHLYAAQPLSEAGQRLSQAILRLRRSERVQADRAVRASQLSSIDLSALRYLVQGHRDGRNLSPKDLITMLDTSSATVTNVVERLVSRGYLIRERHPTDRRAHYLRPTDEAVRHVQDAYGARDAAVVQIIDELSDSDAEIAAEVIDRLARALDRLATADDAI
ncbi:hypothetical protein GCM10009808_17880 [Microbacterium sediminicola]|uniref:HTH marR-type domain-containing protein n=1 Tax=Microbacterium sediminicola TaxID=415210 RepID=A0ABN2I925_9MICO